MIIMYACECWSTSLTDEHKNNEWLKIRISGRNDWRTEQNAKYNIMCVSTDILKLRKFYYKKNRSCSSDRI